MRALIRDGRLPRDVYLTMPCVGVIPYEADVRTLDRMGLTDAMRLGWCYANRNQLREAAGAVERGLEVARAQGDAAKAQELEELKAQLAARRPADSLIPIPRPN